MHSNRMRRVVHTLAILGVAGALVAAAPPQDRWEQQVRRLLEHAATTTASSGYVSTHEAKIGTLRDDQTTTWTLSLNAGTEYRIIGVCDADCSDLDLKLYNPAGTLVSEDVAVDDVPILSIVPPATREYTLRIVMATCSTSPCRFGVGVYGR